MEILPKEKEALLSEFGKRLESLIYRKFRSKEQFLAASGFYKANLHDIVTGKSDPQLSTVYRLAKALEVPLETLFAMDGEPMRAYSTDGYNPPPAVIRITEAAARKPEARRSRKPREELPGK